MAEWQAVAAENEVAEGKQIIVQVGRKEIGIFYEGGHYYAVLNVCPHAQAPICNGGKVEGVLTATADGEYEYQHDRKVLRCPWHHWEFELESGHAVCHTNKRIRVYEVKIEEGKIYVKV